MKCRRNGIFLVFFFLILFRFGNAAELKIGKIKFSGNYFLSNKELLSVVHSFAGGVYNQKILNDDAKRISELYAHRGYYNVKVSYPQIETNNPQAIDVIFAIEENGKIRIDSLFISGNKYISRRKIKQIIPSRPDLNQLSRSLREITDFYEESGFLFAAVRLDSLVEKDGNFAAFLSVSEGDYCEFSDYKFRGNEI